MIPVVAESDPRALWLTLTLYAAGLAIVGADVWVVLFWSAVGAPIGVALSVAGGLVALILAGLVAVDARRQWLLFRVPGDQQ